MLTWHGREPARADGIAALGRLARRALLCLQPQLLRVRLHESPSGCQYPPHVAPAIPPFQGPDAGAIVRLWSCHSTARKGLRLSACRVMRCDKSEFKKAGESN